MSYDLSHVDTCLPCYLMDHHYRDGELLLCAAVDGRTTHREVREQLLNELHGGNAPDGFSYNQAKDAINREFPETCGDDAFDDSLEFDDENDDCDESVYAYFVLTF